ncbi:MAG TPA: 2-oxo acid dehydrogenase subunit E2, partial [Streptosporangiaceae bacterium]|nr:2-oxo acid dehydrogenase subunit E2 [Streptosporangiaceae bacterium]
MSAVSSGSPRATADLNAQSANGSASGSGDAAEVVEAGADFGPNQWLVDELYQRYQADPSSVDRAWWNFFADYHPSPEQAAPAPPAPAPPPGPAGGPNGSAPLAAPAPPAAPAAPRLAPVAPAPAPAPSGEQVRLRGAAARTVANMSASLTVPTATSVRAIPAKLLADNRIVINNHLARGRGGKVSFTHLIGYALVRALAVVPEMNNAYADVDGKPVLVQPAEINLGLAIDIRREDGSRQLLVPSIKSAQNMDFRQFWGAYEDIVRKARSGKLTVEDFAGTTISLTNPGTIGTEHSVPRLMQGQGCIVGVGAMEYPAAYQGASAETIARMAISKTVTLTSTYDHRIIQGAQSGDFLRVVHQLLLGEDGFYDE